MNFLFSELISDLRISAAARLLEKRGATGRFSPM